MDDLRHAHASGLLAEGSDLRSDVVSRVRSGVIHINDQRIGD
jgi:hypothetical protein